MSGWDQVKSLTLGKKIGLVVIGVATATVMGASASNKPATQPVIPAGVLTAPQTKAAVIEKKIVTEKQEIPFESKTENDSTLTSGATELAISGANGERTITFEVTYKDGIETSRTETSNLITAQPITQVTRIGTYIAPAKATCPNGTYINSAGNEVCSPYSSNSAPAGATARCSDGTYSFSQSRSGTCSHHGGVSTWL